jgi:polyhydroxyalkanoate synthase subunit PhaC
LEESETDMHNTTFDDYMLRAVLASVNAARETCGSQQMHLAGYCIGGTIVTALMAWVNRRLDPTRRRPTRPF